MKKSHIILRLLRIPLDFLAVSAAFLLAYHWRSAQEWIPFVSLPVPSLMPLEDFILFSLQAALLVVVLMAWERRYRFQHQERLLRELRKILPILGASFTVIILYFFLVGITFFSRFILGTAFVLAIFLMVSHRVILRIIQKWMWRRGIGRRKVVLVGQGKVLEELREIWGKDPAFEILEQFDDNNSAFTSFVQENHIDEIVQIGDVRESAALVEYCQLNYVEYRFVPNMLDVQRTNTEIDFVRDIPLITLRSSAIDGWGRVVKRSIDVVGAGAGLLLLSPLLLIIGTGVKLQDGGPVFYLSERISKNKKFLMWKFRTMVVNADQMKKDLEEQNRRSGPLFKIERDPRVTTFGRFLRRTTLDELPQLWNVLRGDLSLVGPRAHLPAEIEQYEKHHRRVLAVKAGVTGLPQVSGRSRLDFEQEVKLDVYYIENWSVWLDFKIMVRTFGVLFDGE